MKKTFKITLCLLPFLVMGLFLWQKSTVKSNLPYSFQGTYQDPHSRTIYIVIDEDQQSITYLNSSQEEKSVCSFIKVDSQTLLVQDDLFQGYVVLLDKEGIRLLNPDLEDPTITVYEKKTDKLLSINN